MSSGTYYLQVDGTGWGDPLVDGYSGYSSLGTFTISGTAPTDGTPTPSVATLYGNCSFGRGAVALGDYTLSQLQAKGYVNDQLSSLRVSPGYEVQLFDNDNYSGGSIVLKSSANCLVYNSSNDAMSSIRVLATANVSNASTGGLGTGSTVAAGGTNAAPAAPAELRLYPNPVTSQLSLSGPDLTGGRLSVLNTLGQQVWESVYQEGKPLNVSQLRTGTHLLRIAVPNQPVIIRRFVK